MKVDPFKILFAVAICVCIFAITALNDMQDKYQSIVEKLIDTDKKLLVCETEKKYHISQNKNPCPSSNSSETGIYHKHLREIIKATLNYLKVDDVEDWTRLILLTAITESDGGRYTRQIKGPARSIFQNEPETERECLQWIKVKHPELYKRIKNLRVPAKLKLHEGEYNIAYGVAMTYMEYFRRKVNPKGKSALELAKIHKVHYNTYLGSGSVDRTMKKLQAFNIKL